MGLSSNDDHDDDDDEWMMKNKTVGKKPHITIIGERSN